MKDEALRLALEALEMFCEHGAILRPIETRDAIKAALANEALERKAENARELGLDYAPLEAKDETAQQRMNKLPFNDSFERDEAARNIVREFMRNH
jgi:stage III sporulation protein SpoIIIAA